MRLTIELPYVPNPEQSVLTLCNLVLDAHYRAATSNKNISSEVFVAAVQGSLSFKSGVIAALSTIGGPHAPIAAARIVFERITEEEVREIVQAGGKIPGFGNSFFRDDPAWEDVRQFVADKHPEVTQRLANVGSWTGKDISPNAAMWTGVLCSLLGWPRGMEDMLFILGRLPAWGALIR